MEARRQKVDHHGGRDRAGGDDARKNDDLEPAGFDRGDPAEDRTDEGPRQSDQAGGLGLINHYYWYSAAAEQGEENMRARIVFGESGDVAALVNATGVGILQSAADDDNALAFVEFLLSEQAQTYFVESQYEYPLVPGIAGPEGVPPLDSLRGPDIDLSDLGTVEESAALIDEAGLTVG